MIYKFIAIIKVNRRFLSFIAIAIVLFILFVVPVVGTSASKPESRVMNALADGVPMSNEDCLECHANPDMYLPLPNGEELYLTIDGNGFDHSVHGSQGYACTQCHTDIKGYPHPPLGVNNLRDVSLQMVRTCQNCHTQTAKQYDAGRHAEAIAEGLSESAICTDCHSAHETQSLREDNFQIALTCRTCHAEIYDKYKDSVHGKALIEEGNRDVPTCIDCHNSHDNTGPDDPDYVLFSPQVCAKCHDDEGLMAKYGVNTEVFDTYVSDFHGSTVVLFEEISPGQETNKPVCIDCHGVHDILPPTDENSPVIKQNLLVTCQRCHPDAPPNFSDAWLSHYPPDMQHNTLVYLVDLFYRFFIPITLGGMVLFVFTDMWHHWGSGKQKDKQTGDQEVADEG